MQSSKIEAQGGQRLQGHLCRGCTGSPLVTIITAVWNADLYLEQCLQSVLAQDYPHIEHIVLDAGSTDRTLSILRQYEDRIALWMSEPDKGVFDAWNKGITLARGEWIAFLGADDVYLPGAVSAYMRLAGDHPEAEFLSSKARLDHVTGYAPVFGGPWDWPRFSRAMTTIHVGTMHRRSLFDSLGSFNTEYLIAGDYEFMLRAKHTLKAAFTPAITVVMRAGGLSDSTAGLYEAHRAKLHTGVKTPSQARTELLRSLARFHARRVYLCLRQKVVALVRPS